MNYYFIFKLNSSHNLLLQLHVSQILKSNLESEIKELKHHANKKNK